MPFHLIRGDITKLRVDAIVNAANRALAPGGGVCGAIFAAAGYDKLERACRAIGGCETGGAALTPGFALPAKYIIHTVGPVWQGGGHDEARLLKSCYRNSLRLAREHGCGSIAFPLISAGIYGYPKAEAMRIAAEAVREFLAEDDLDVTLALFERGEALLGQELLGEVRSFIDDHYAERHSFARTVLESPLFLPDASVLQAPSPRAAVAPAGMPPSLIDAVNHIAAPFSQVLLECIDQRGLSDAEVYRRANLDRRLFSKLRRRNYHPSKSTVLALAVALRLNLAETEDLLRCAGYALSRSNKADVILEYFIRKGRYDIFEINQALFAFDQKLLGA